MFPIPSGNNQSGSPARPEPVPVSHYCFLAEVSLRRLVNRARHASSKLRPDINAAGAAHVAASLWHLEGQLEQWLACLPAALRFTVPIEAGPAAVEAGVASTPEPEPQLVKLMRERYVEVRGLLCRGFLFLCVHGGSRLSAEQAIAYGGAASVGLRLAVYRIRTERPFFRHMGSFMACRVRANHALSLLAAARARDLGVPSARHVVVPPCWRESVVAVRDRLEIWADHGAGIPELAALLTWLLDQMPPRVQE